MHWTPAHHRLRWCEQQRPGLKKRIGFCENLYGFQLLEVCSFLGELSKNCFLGEFDPSTWKLAVITPKLHQKKPPFCGSGTFLVPPAVHCWIQSRPQRPLQDLASLLHCENRLFCFLRVMKLNPRDIHVLVHDCSSGVGHVHGAWNSFIISRHLANQNLFHLLQTKALSQEMEAHTQPRNATSNRNLIMCSMGKVKCSWKTSNKTNKTNDSPGPFWFYLTIHSQSHAFSSWDPCHGVAPTQAPSSPTAVHVWVAIGKEWSFAQKVSSSAFLHILRKKSKSAPTSPSLLQLLPAQHQQPKEKKKCQLLFKKKEDENKPTTGHFFTPTLLAWRHQCQFHVYSALGAVECQWAGLLDGTPPGQGRGPWHAELVPPKWARNGQNTTHVGGFVYIYIYMSIYSVHMNIMMLYEYDMVWHWITWYYGFLNRKKPSSKLKNTVPCGCCRW